MKNTALHIVKSEPKRFLEFLRQNRYEVYHRSNLFFRDIQYGLWRYLQENQSKVSYADMERLAKEVVDEWERQGTLKRINRQSFELNMPEYLTVVPAAEAGKEETEPPKGKPAPASGPAANQPPAASDAAAADDPEKAARLAALQERMAAARAKRENGEG